MKTITYKNLIELLELINKVVAKYPNVENAYELAIKGALFGLERYIEKDRKVKLMPYLAYFIKTSIEKGDDHV